MEIKGYKAFDENKQNRYGVPFVPGAIYHVDGQIIFGNYGNGYHFCKELSDVFRYVDTSREVCVAEVTGFGKFAKYDDEYYGYYDMYAIESIRIDRFLTREEIIAKMLEDNETNCKKFLCSFNLTDDEKIMFIRKYRDNRAMLEYIFYYQYGCFKIYEMKKEERERYMRKVLAYGQDNRQGCQGK